ncbi:MAG: bifunctional phosphoglucose/phosphomannose isomerase [Chloroflexi bacterium GWC2_73_18]|nr:MAG: bifunctional phosphoglucose/phosphomannose isomerase [Chloroflexi bacterium GWC2_73_18]
MEAETSRSAPPLDDPGVLRRFDRGAMLERIATLPAQLRDGWALSRGLTLPAPYREATAVLVLGMGGSAIGADLVRGVFADRLPVPLVVSRDHVAPAFAGPATLVVASSYSGATEETIAATEAALVRGCPTAVIATGGPLAEAAAAGGLPLLRFPAGGQPRAAIGWSAILLAGLLERAGQLDLSGSEVEEAAAAAAARVASDGPEVATERNPAKQLAWSLLDRVAVVVGADHLAPVARRWKTQLNENGKSWAAWDELPEATHNTIVGFAQPEMGREHLFAVFLASAGDHPRTALRREVMAEQLGEAQTAHARIEVRGTSRLAQAFDAIALGDLVSVYLAALYGIDPTPVEAIDRCKARLVAT